MKKLDWLEDFAKSRKAALAKSTSGKKVVASKKAVAEIQGSDMIIMPKSRLPKATNGNTVKFKNCKWKVVNASYRDAKGAGVVLKKVAGIDTKKLTDPEFRARNEQVDFGALDYNVSENSEIPKFTSEAESTVQAISAEDARDMTTPGGRYGAPSGEIMPMGNADSAFAGVDDAPMGMEMGTDDSFGDDALEMPEDDDMADAELDEDFGDDEFAEESDMDDMDDMDGMDSDMEDMEDVEEDDAFADDVIEEDSEEMDDMEDVEDEDEEEKAVVARRRPKHKNRIIAAMLRA